jgi:hypothetical protein
MMIIVIILSCFGFFPTAQPQTKSQQVHSFDVKTAKIESNNIIAIIMSSLALVSSI